MSKTPRIGVSDSQSLTEPQRQVCEAMIRGPRGGVPKPFLAMLDAPQLMDAIQSVGRVLRFSSELPPNLREAAIITVASVVGSGYEWSYHEPLAIEAQVPRDVIEVIRRGESAYHLPDPWQPSSCFAARWCSIGRHRRDCSINRFCYSGDSRPPN